MKLRIKGNSIRLRLSRRDIAQLETNGRVEEWVEFGRTGRFGYALEVGGETVAASFAGGRITVSLPYSLAREWTASDRIGIEAGGTPQILIEKDFACLTPRVGEDESEMFRHPGGAAC